MSGSTSVLDVSPVIPVVTIDDADHAVPLARALLAGGIGIIEVTLRTSAGLPSLRRIAEEVPQMLVGAGTVLSVGQAEDAVAAGAQFLVSPGTTERLLAHLASLAVPVLPWHTDRLRIIDLGAALTRVAAALGKIARDVTLLAQSEVGEVSEVGDELGALGQVVAPDGMAP